MVKSDLQETTMGQRIFQPPYCDWTPAQILVYFQQRTHVHYFPVRDPEQTQPAKLAAMLDNVFEFNGEAYQLSDPVEWLTNPSPDQEWLILWHKFYYAVGMGETYYTTGDRRYAAAWLALTERWIDTTPLDFLSSDVMGRRVQNWIFAHYYFVSLGQTPGLTPEFYLKFLASLYEQVTYLCNHLTPARNHRTIELYAIFLAAVVFPEFKQAAQWLAFAKDELAQNLQTDLLPDGVQYELSIDYHCLVLKNYLNIRKLAKLNAIDLPPLMDELLQKALRFTLFVHKPDGMIPALSDGDSRSFLDLLWQGYELYGDEELCYVASGGQSGRAPAARSVGFPNSGYYILRSGWGDAAEAYRDARYFVFDCGPLGVGNHGHLDLLNFEMAAYGQSLIVDPGRYTYSEAGPVNWRVLFRGTSYHNTVQVDNLNQTRYQLHKKRFKIQGPPPDYELKAFITNPAFDYLHGVARSHEYPVIHERKVFFAQPDYWIITDILHATDEHTYNLRFHLSDTAWQQLVRECDANARWVEAPHLIIMQPLDPAIDLLVEDGFISRTYGMKQIAPVVRFTARGSSMIFHTLLYPFKEARPAIKLERLPVLCNETICTPTTASALRITITGQASTTIDTYYEIHHPRFDDAEEVYLYHFDGCTVRYPTGQPDASPPTPLFLRQILDGTTAQQTPPPSCEPEKPPIPPGIQWTPGHRAYTFPWVETRVGDLGSLSVRAGNTYE